MSEEQQAVLEEDQGFTIEGGEVETPETEGLEASVESATTEDEQEEPSHESGEDGVQKRINKLTAEKYAEKRKREALEARLKELESKSTAPAVATSGKPTLEQFDFDRDAYDEAMIDWKLEQKIAATQTATQKQQAEAKAKQLDDAFDNAEAKYVEKNPEYVELVQNLPRFPNETLTTIKGQENGPQLVHYLGKNLELADKIASLNPYDAAVQIGIISANLAAKTKPVKPTSTAPEPINPIKSGGQAIKETGPKGVVFE